VSPIAQLRFRVRSRSRPFVGTPYFRPQSFNGVATSAPEMTRRPVCIGGVVASSANPRPATVGRRRVRSHHKNWVAKRCAEHHIVRNLAMGNSAGPTSAPSLRRGEFIIKHWHERPSLSSVRSGRYVRGEHRATINPTSGWRACWPEPRALRTGRNYRRLVAQVADSQEGSGGFVIGDGSPFG
jgi:hypothetical protein